MGVYVITGGSAGIGKKTGELLKKQGHSVFSVAIRDSDFDIDLSLQEGRQKAIDKITELYPEGIDGLICSAAVPASCGDLKMILSLNFFGTTSMVTGMYDLLKKKKGTCVVISSNAISMDIVRMDLVDMMTDYYDSEFRIRGLLEKMDATDLEVGNEVYVASKFALARWMRRHSASFAANGVRINAVAPGNVNTRMTATMSRNERMALNALPIPTKYGQETLMSAEEVAMAIVFLVSPAAVGVNGIVMFVDGGTDALLNSEKVY